MPTASDSEQGRRYERGAARARPAVPPGRTVALAQAALFLGTGLWPLFHMRSFQAVTGPKADGWLVETVGGLVTVTGGVLGLAGASRRVTLEMGLLGAGSSAVLAAIDIHYVRRRRISPIYLLDALAESALMVGWAGAAARAAAPVHHARHISPGSRPGASLRLPLS